MAKVLTENFPNAGPEPSRYKNMIVNNILSPLNEEDEVEKVSIYKQYWCYSERTRLLYNIKGLKPLISPTF
jgi:hypothetical protein